MKWVWIALGVLAALAACVYVVGLFVAREHEASVRVRLRRTPEAIFDAIADIDGVASWRAGTHAHPIDPIDGKPAFVEESKHGTVRFVVEVSERPRRRVVRIADGDLPYGGTWTFAIEHDGDGARITITEAGFVKPAVFRALARFVFGYHATLEDYLRALGKKFGEDVTPERVR